MSNIIYTKIDEAPALATYSLLPIIQAFTSGSGIKLETRDISLAARILAAFPDQLTAEQQMPDHLAELGELTQSPEANIIKLPNISASVPQLQAAIRELQDQGYALPNFPEDPQNEEEVSVKNRYAKVLGSAVNPVLREGNSDRRAALSVKRFAQNNPPRLKAWNPGSKTRVAHMADGDFFGSEKSAVIENDGNVCIEYAAEDGSVTILKDKVAITRGEVIDSSVMNVRKLRDFYSTQIEESHKDGMLLSLHLKATMMKVSDPVLFGHAVSIFYSELFEKHRELFEQIGINPNNGLGDVSSKIENLPQDQQNQIKQDIDSIYQKRPELAMVDSDKGITNLHLPNNVIIDASMPVVVRDGGKMWGPDGMLRDTVAMIPDRCYATIYQEVIEDCQRNGAYDPATMGNVANVGLMAQKAEEYGSHDKTFLAPGTGTIRLVDDSGSSMLEQPVEPGDVFRMCQVKDAPIQDWVKLAVNRARATGSPAVFWLDEQRQHHTCLINKVNAYLEDHDTQGLELHIMSPVEAMRFSLERIRKGQDTISVTGNVLRDYLTDLFPILELGTSAKMLSIVPQMKGGGLFETGAGGSAPKHVQQFLEEGHLRWDSLGEMLALGVSFEHLASVSQNATVKIYSDTIDEAVGQYLENRRSPSRKVHELDNRGSHFYFALYWAEALASQEEDQELKVRFSKIARDLSEKETMILEELNAAQGQPVDIGGYFLPDDEKASQAMRPSPSLNGIIESLN
ncbi:MAG: isocitrate dehydrogenase (NADP(+)) [Deltaproteobacteria bacterium]|nr:isocitrate dehydrogenase (NADP(+)) [Deltaproteobacteria bacterium]